MIEMALSVMHILYGMLENRDTRYSAFYLLTARVEVVDEVRLRLELPCELLRGDLADGAFL